VLAVQELKSQGVQFAADRMREFADAVRMECSVPSAEPDGSSCVAVAAASTRFNVGLLWRPGIKPVPGSVRTYADPGDLWHGLVMLGLDIGGPAPVRFVSYHADPFRPDRRFADAIRVAAIIRGRLPTVVCADWNNISADRRRSGEFYDEDPFPTMPFFPALLQQVRWCDDPDAAPRADRRSTEVVRRAGLYDVAAALDSPWQATTGHWPGARYGPRRIDAVRVNGAMLPALRRHQVVDTELTRLASDHLPVVVTIDPNAIDSSD
jgi:endonuclease/exonuclease/phosphatase family metal-dependent hydrolase